MKQVDVLQLLNFHVHTVVILMLNKNTLGVKKV